MMALAADAEAWRLTSPASFMAKPLRILAFCTLLALSAGAAAAPPSPAAPPRNGPRPRIGLALGGGSARGIAHIGVLQWLEDHRVPVDVIAGTSIGGLIAGGYATGMSPAELRTLMRTTDWDAMFVGDSPFRYKTFRRKQDRRAFPTQLEFGLRQGLTLPAGLNTGQQVTLMLDRITLPYYDIDSFDDLPTPFRCVATDLRTADSVVLGKGSLTQAMRATMAIPGIFTPVHYDGWLLVDGGTLNNVPGDVTRAMGADVVLAVNVGADTKAEQSLFALLGRTIDTMMAAGARKGLGTADIVIDPDLEGVDAMSWRRSEELADRGYRAADRVAAQLLHYAVSEEEFAAHMAVRRARRRTTMPVPRTIEVGGVPEAERAAIRRQLADNLDVPLDTARIERDILQVAGSDRYEYVSYRLAVGPDGPGLVVFARPKSYGPPFLAMGAEFNNVDGSNFAATLGTRTTIYDIAGSGSEVRVDVALGTRQVFGAEFYKPVGGTRLFAAPRTSYTRTPTNDIEDGRLLGQYMVKRAGAGIDVGINTGRQSELRAGYDVAEIRGRLSVGTPVHPAVQGAEQFASVRFTYDGQDSALVPSRGILWRSDVRRYVRVPQPLPAPGAAATRAPGFWRGETTASVFHAVNGQDRLFGVVGGGTTFGALPAWGGFSLGGPVRMGAFANDELRGANYLLGVGGYLKQVGHLPDVLGGHAYAGAWLETGSAFGRWGDAAWHGDVSGGLILETLLGPVFAGGSVGFDGHPRFYISIGPLF